MEIPDAQGPADLAALRDLSLRYAAAADARDGDSFAALFEPDGELVVPKYPDDLRPVVTRKGTAALSEVPGVLARYLLTFHQVSNHQVRVDGDDASGDVQCVAHHLSGNRGELSGNQGEATDTVWFIRYEDIYRRRAGEWRFRQRVLHLQFVEHHAVERVGAGGGTGGP